MSSRFLFDRRSGGDRRSGKEQRENPRLDLPHKRRRQKTDRRQQFRSKTDDFYAASSFVYRDLENRRGRTKH